MSRKLYITLFVILAVSMLTVGCGGCNNSDDKEISDIPENIQIEKQTQPVNDEVIDQIVSSFPSPVTIAAIIHSLDIPFSKKYLVDPDIIENYDSNNKKAFALGVISADLGYLNVYERTNLIVQYLSSIKRLSDDLRIGQFFDFQALKRLATTNDNMDSLIYLSISSFNKMDQHLRNNARGNLSLLMITGVWLEGMYLMTQVAKESDDPRLIDQIGSQKVIFNMLYPVLKMYKDDKYFQTIANEFKKFDKIFSQITITYETGKTETKYIDGRPVIIQNERSVVNITDEQLKDLIYTTEQVRNKLINL